MNNLGTMYAMQPPPHAGQDNGEEGGRVKKRGEERRRLRGKPPLLCRRLPQTKLQISGDVFQVSGGEM